METVLGVTVISAKVIASGFLLSLGFWGGKKLTSYLDYRFKLLDKEFMSTIANEYPFDQPVKA